MGRKSPACAWHLVGAQQMLALLTPPLSSLVANSLLCLCVPQFPHVHRQGSWTKNLQVLLGQQKPVGQCS